jgi:eukaryotic-like serine/threonine-protein kinase
MSLGPGTRLGPYEIVAPIGAGGMGEVYKAKDTRLDRTVAIKVLPSHVSGDPTLRERFEREARTIGALNHPHICTLYDVGHETDGDFLVLEYLEGQTLAERLTKGALALDQALQFAIQIADALDKAHRAGIIHRDLKPGNIMLTKSGAKLLDFGLAKTSLVVASTGLSMLPTTPPATITAQGTILGTLQYMAPEQIEGQEADARTDIFAFGAVLYEMLTGRKAFEGKTQAGLIGAILKDTSPSTISLQPLTPPALDRIVRTCLAKDPDDRWQSARDLNRELTWIVEAGAQRDRGATRVVRPSHWWTLAIAITIVISALWSLGVWNLSRSAPIRRPVRLSILLPASDQLFGFALSPDGETLVFAAGRGNVRQLYRRTLDQLAATPIPGTTDGRYPFFSPDGAWIGFEAEESLKKVPLAGGVPVTIYDRASGTVRATNATWGADGRIVFGTYGAGGRLYQISASGGMPQPVTTLTVRGEINHSWPEILPGGEAVLYTVSPSTKIVVQSLETGERHDIADGAQARYVPSGHIVFVRGASLWAIPFDLDRLIATGPAVPVVADLGAGTQPISSNSIFTIAPTGTLVYSQNPEIAGQRLAWVDRDGQEDAVPIAPSRSFGNPRLSPDGRRLVLVRRDESGSSNTEIWIYDLATNTERQLTFDPAANVYPIWTPDGQRIVFSSNRAGGRNLFWRPADGSGRDERLTTSPNIQSPWAWSSDGMNLIFAERNPATDMDIAVLSMSGDRQTRALIGTRFTETEPDVSPDGRWIAYYSNETGREEVYVRPFPNVDGGKWRVSMDGGADPLWGPDGHELFYLSIDGSRLMAVPVMTMPTFVSGMPKALFERRYARQSGAISYDVSPDGQRFLIIKEGSETDQASARSEFTVVLNFFEELKRLVPTK